MSSRISKIEISNIKGFGYNGSNLDINLVSNRINIVIAPNGFGKSSLATAFDCISKNRARLVVDKDLKYQENENLKSSVRIVLNDREYLSDDNKNDINKALNCFVINCKIKAGTISKGNGQFTTTKGFIDIEDAVASKVIMKPKFEYKVSVPQRGFGVNGKKLIKNLEELFKNKKFLVGLPDVFDSLSKFESKGRAKIIEDVLKVLHCIRSGNDSIPETVFAAIQKEEPYLQIIGFVRNYKILSDKLEEFNAFFQLYFFYKKYGKGVLNKMSKWAKYQILKENLKNAVDQFNTSEWQKVSVVEHSGELQLRFPNANVLSNGQRDILTFISQLLIIRAQLNTNKPNLIIIDEVFDYLDDAMILGAQYYLSRILKDKGAEVILVLLTHLDYKYFRSYAFSKKKINVQYLLNTKTSTLNGIREFIQFREQLGKKDQDGKEKIDRYFFHYAPKDELDEDLQIKLEKDYKMDFPQKWLSLHCFKSNILKHLNKYLHDGYGYDPYAVCFALRFGIEKKVYDSLSYEDKEEFLNTHRTENKIEFAEAHGLEFPEAFRVLSIIYNDALHPLHLEGNHDCTQTNLDKTCVLKLQNKVIRHIIKSIFKYQNTDLGIECIE